MKKDIKKIMFINPPVTRPRDFSAKVVRVSPFLPLGIAYLAASIEKEGGYELAIVDALIEGDINAGAEMNGGEMIRYGLKDEEIKARIKKFVPDVVGVSCLFSAVQGDMANIAKLAKEVDPGIVTIAGGAHAGGMAIDILKMYPEIDIIVIGEGEVTSIELFKKLKKGESLSSLDGIAYRDGGEIKYLPKTTYIEDLDSLPFPARHLFPMEKYFSSGTAHASAKNKPFTQMITSRGCPFKCAFCALGNHWGADQRMRSAGNVLDEIEHLIKTYGIKEIHFEDDNLTSDKKRAMEIFDGMIERKFNLTWNVPTGMAVSTLLDEDLLVKMKASGCYSISLAIENGNQSVLSKLMNKPVNLKVVPGLVQKIRKIGMDVKGFFIIGYPDETKETIRETVEFAKNLELDWAYFFIASPLPNTRMYKTCIEKGYMKEGDFDPFISFRKSVIRTPEFTPEYLEEVREEAIVNVNFRNNPNLLKYDIDKAIGSFKEVVNFYPHFDFANFYLGEAYLKKGDRKNAVASYKNTLAANPSHKEAKERLASLKAA